jgi:uncharacterized membrane protein
MQNWELPSMQRQIFLFALGAALMASAPAWSATDLNAPKGLWLTTDYPSRVVRAGEVADIQLRLRNAGLPPAALKLSVDGLPSGWKSSFTGGGQPVLAAMPATGDTVDLDLHLDIPAGAKSGPHDLTVFAKGDTENLQLPIEVDLGDVLPPKLEMKAQLPALKGSPSSSFDYSFTVKNDSGKNLVVSLNAEAPQNFQASFTQGYGSQEINSIPIDAGQSKDLKIKVQPPADVPAGSYQVKVAAAAEGADAAMPLAMQITGQPHLRLSGKGDRLSAEAQADKPSQVDLVLTNDGSAPAQGIELSASPPSDWQVSFDSKTVDQLAPGETKTVVATLTPSAKALAGDYMTTFRAAAGGESSSADFRVAVTTSTLWGVFGIALIAIALIVLVGAVARYGRR